MNRRDAFRGIVAGASVGLSGAAVEASFQPTVPFGPRLIRPNRGARLEAWLAESDRRSADVAIDWERGLLRVTLREKHSDLPDGMKWDRWLDGSDTVAESASLPEDAPGSFTPEDAGIAGLIDRVAAGVVAGRERVAKAMERHERMQADANRRMDEMMKLTMLNAYVSMNKPYVMPMPGTFFTT